MTKPVVYSILFVLCLVLQLVLAPVIAIGGVQPNFLAVFVVVVAVRSGYGVGSLAGFLCGLFEDFAGSGTIGCMALALTVVALLAGVIGGFMQTQSPLAAIALGVFSALVTELGYGIASILAAPDAGGGLSLLATYSLPCAVYTAVFMCLALFGASVLLGTDAQAGPGKGSYSLGGGTKFPKINSRLK